METETAGRRARRALTTVNLGTSGTLRHSSRAAIEPPSHPARQIRKHHRKPRLSGPPDTTPVQRLTQMFPRTAESLHVMALMVVALVWSALEPLLPFFIIWSLLRDIPAFIRWLAAQERTLFT
jgi:hypothetical protein